jgi:hypothetical protein
MKNFFKILKQIILFPYRFIKGRRKPATAISNIKPGSGGIITENDRKIAIYKDNHGNITKLSPVCSHLGCLVHWNSQEDRWTCKCHQSHFKPRGKLISGPATKGLKRLDKLEENQHIVRILMTEFVTHDVMRFIVEKPDNYEFTPGQATLVSINKPGQKNEKRPFTFTSLNNDEVLEFTIKKYPDHNGVTEKLHQLTSGDELIIEEPWGAIKYKSDGIFIAGGTGITPFIAILRQLKEEDRINGNQLFFSNKTRKDVILEKELRNTFNSKDLIITLTRENQDNYYHGRIDKEFLEKNIQDFSQEFYVCGPPEFTKDITKHLQELGAKPDEIIIEE